MSLAKTDRTNTTIIAEGTECTGELSVIGKLHIDGKMTGTVYSEGFISIGISGSVLGDIQAEKIIVSGKIEGNVTCNSLEIMQSGDVRGEINTTELVIEHGGVFIGNSRRMDEVTPALSASSELYEAEVDEPQKLTKS